MTGQRIFISHASENADVADRIVAYLEGRGVPCWISSRDIPPKEIYAEAIAQAMRDAQSCVVIVSAASNASAAVKRELELASRYNKPFIPIRIDETEPGPGLDYYLNNTQWVDYGRDREHGLDRIVSAYAARMGERTPVPTPAVRPKRNPWLIPLVVVAVLMLAVVGWFAMRPRPQAARQADASQIASALVGAYIWDSIECGQGPTISAQGDTLVFTMAGTPTYRHQVLSATRAPQGYEVNVYTRVLEPAEARGTEYSLSLDNDVGVLTVGTTERSDQWVRCDRASTAPPRPSSSPEVSEQLPTQRSAGRETASSPPAPAVSVPEPEPQQLLAGTWSGTYDFGPGIGNGSIIFRFSANGSFSTNDGGSGRWSQNGAEVSWIYTGGTRFAGTVDGQHISGAIFAPNGARTGSFSLVRG